MIYFIQAGQGGLIKIGYTQISAEKRRKGLQTACPVRLMVLGTMSGGREEETALHHRFETYSEHGEWFRPEPELMDFIRGVQKNVQGKTTKTSTRKRFCVFCGEPLRKKIKTIRFCNRKCSAIWTAERKYGLLPKHRHISTCAHCKVPSLVVSRGLCLGCFFGLENGVSIARKFKLEKVRNPAPFVFIA